MNCPICCTPTEFAFEVNRFPIFECRSCGHRLTWPRNPETHISDTYNDDYFFAGGAGYPNYMDEKHLLIKHGRQYARVLRSYIPEQGKLLDVGSAAGFILKGLTDSGWNGHGIEPNGTMAAYARSRLGLDVTTGTIESFKATKQYNVVCLIQVIAHMVDPNTTLSVVSKVLPAGGYVLVETWNSRSWTARIFGRRWHEYSPPSVLHWFCPVSLERLFSRNNFKRIAEGRPSKKLSWKHAKALISHKTRDLPFFKQLEKMLDSLPDWVTVPYPAEDLFWALYKKST